MDRITAEVFPKCWYSGALTGDRPPWKNRKIAGGRKASPAIQMEGPPDRATGRPWRSRRCLRARERPLPGRPSNLGYSRAPLLPLVAPFQPLAQFLGRLAF